MIVSVFLDGKKKIQYFNFHRWKAMKAVQENSENNFHESKFRNAVNDNDVETSTLMCHNDWKIYCRQFQHETVEIIIFILFFFKVKRGTHGLCELKFLPAVAMRTALTFI